MLNYVELTFKLNFILVFSDKCLKIFIPYKFVWYKLLFSFSLEE